MAITLYGRRTSNNVQKVLWTLGEIGRPFEHVEVGGRFGGLDTAEFRALNPNGKVPVLRDGDLVMWESNAIVRYLAAEYAAGSLFPATPRERAACDQWTDWCATTFQPAWIGVFWNLVRTPEAERDADAIARGIERTELCLAILDGQLARTAWLAGSRMSYADIIAGDAMFRWTTMPIERQAHPHVERWHRQLRERPAFRAGIEIDYSELVGRLTF